MDPLPAIIPGFLRAVFAAVLPILVVSCAKPAVVQQPVPVTPKDPLAHLYEWHGDEVEGPIRVRISLSDQKAYFTKSGQEVGWTYVATGLPGHSTPTGSFRVTEKVIDKYSNRYGVIVDENGDIINDDAKAGVTKVPPGARYVGASMPFWMRLTNYGIGMHAGPIPNPGSPASHGCIRMPPKMAEIIHHQVVLGTPVKIER